MFSFTKSIKGHLYRRFKIYAHVPYDSPAQTIKYSKFFQHMNLRSYLKINSGNRWTDGRPPRCSQRDDV